MDLNKPIPSVPKSRKEDPTASLALFLEAFEAAPVGILMIGVAHRRIMFSNAEAERILGLAKHQMAHRGIGDLCADPRTRWTCRDTDKRVYALEDLPSFKAAFQGEISKNQEMVIHQPGGGDVWVINNTFPIYTERGDIIAIVTFLSDITGTKRKTEALQKGKEYLDYVLIASEEGLWDWDLDTDQGYLSPRYYEMLGYENGEFAGSRGVWATMLHPDDKEKALGDITDFITHKTPHYNSSYRMRARDNTYRWIQSKAIVVDRGENGKPRRLVGTHLDITQRKEMEQRLQRSHAFLEQEVKKRTRDLIETNQKLETVLNSSSESIWVCDGDGKVISINKASERLLEVTAEEVVGKNVTSLVGQGFMDRSVTTEVIATRRQVSMMQYVAKTRKYLLVTGTPVFGDDGTISMVIINERDLTRLNDLRAELQQTRNVSNTYQQELTALNLLELREQEIIAESNQMKQVLGTALKLANFKSGNILILGESGTGKGLLAKFIHSNGGRKKTSFIQINCAALPESLLEAELFGYEKGAFTGARDNGKAGLMELAQGGTLFLDEIGELPLIVQAKLLKCLDEREFVRLGGLKPIKIDCTIIAATNAHLEERVLSRQFRKDLFYRLNTFTIKIPSLRERRDDIFELTRFFLKKFNHDYGCNRRISSPGLDRLQTYDFPGNIRELKNILKKAVVMSEEALIDGFIEKAIPGATAPENSNAPPFNLKGQGLTAQVLAFERGVLIDAMVRHKTTRSLAAFFHVSQSCIVRKLKKHKLSVK